MDLKQRTQTIARWISIVGHPAVVMPFAALIASSQRANTTTIVQAVGLSALCAALVMGYSTYKTRRGDWGHVDASNKDERAELNLKVSAGLLMIAVILWAVGVDKGVVVALMASVGIVMAGHFLRGIAKPSLHVAFGCFGALITWPNKGAFIAMLILACAVVWSRLVLRRHSLRDVWMGALLGISAGVVLQVSMK